jgi:hypothetical protein
MQRPPKPGSTSPAGGEGGGLEALDGLLRYPLLLLGRVVVAVAIL